MTRHPLARAAGRLLGEEVVHAETLHGGDLSEVLRLKMADGRSLVVKSGPFPPREARMLEVIRNCGAPAPLPVAATDEILILEDLGRAASATDAAWRKLGHSLARLHATTASDYGWETDFAFGGVMIRNGWRKSWPDFWVEHRLLAEANRLPRDLAHRIQGARDRIAAHLPEHPPPSLLHGDLWPGNVHFDMWGGAWLIDPASCYGHADADLAMLTLFGQPPPAFWDEYGAPGEGWHVRQAIYQLWPALVHLRLFGSGYRPLVERCLSRVP